MPMVIPLDRYGRTLERKAKATGKAIRNSLNDTGRDLQRAITADAISSLEFRGDPLRSLGIRLSQRATENRLEAIVGSNRGWLGVQTEDGTVRPIRGIRFRGRPMLLIPDPKFRARRGGLKGLSRARLFAIEADGQPLLMARFSRTRTAIVGALVREADHPFRIDWQEVSDKVATKEFPRHYAREARRMWAKFR